MVNIIDDGTPYVAPTPIVTKPETTPTTPPPAYVTGGHEVDVDDPSTGTLPTVTPVPPPPESPLGGHEVDIDEPSTGTLPSTTIPTGTDTSNLVQLGDGKYISKTDYDSLPSNLQRVAKTDGISKLNEAVRRENKQLQLEYEEADREYQRQLNALKALEEYKYGGTTLGRQVNPITGKSRDGGGTTETYYDIHQYLIDKPPGESIPTLRAAGYSWEAIQNAAKYNLKVAEEARQRVQEQYSNVGVAKYAGDIVGDLVVPGYYTAKNWGNMGSGEKAMSIAFDLITIIPFAKAAGMGAREVATAGRLARLSGAAKGLGRETVAQLRAPVDMIAHPVATVKGTVGGIRDLAETLLHPKKIPEAVMTSSNSTVRLRVSETTSPKEAMQIRDTMMDLVRKGEKPVVEINGIKYEMAVPAFMEEAGGGLAHATPMGDVLKGKITVKAKPGMSEAEQGLFAANQPLPRFAETSAFGQAGEKPYFRIFSPETSKTAVPTGKTYRGTVEGEMKFPVGTELPAPKQTLFTRVGPGRTRVEIGLDRPLTVKQIAKLKVLGLVEDLKAPFKPSISISGDVKGLTKRQLRKLEAELERSGNRNTARLLRRSEDDILRAGRRVASLGGRTARTMLDRTNRSRVTPREEARIVREILRTESARARIDGVSPSRVRAERAAVIEGLRAGRTENTRTDATRPAYDTRYPESEDRPPQSRPTRQTDTTPPRTRPIRGDRPPVPPPARTDRTPKPDNIIRHPGRTDDGGRSRIIAPYPETDLELKNKPIILKPGSIAWEQGKLDVDKSSPGPEQVYKYAEPPAYQVKTAIGRAPVGYRDTGRTPRETIQTIGGNVKRKVRVPMGIVEASATPDEKKITFTSVKPSITEKRRALSGRKFPRITPRVGKLR